MDDFNTPGSNKTWMDDGFKKYAAEWQLGNIVNIYSAAYFLLNTRATACARFALRGCLYAAPKTDQL